MSVMEIYSISSLFVVALLLIASALQSNVTAKQRNALSNQVTTL